MQEVWHKDGDRYRKAAEVNTTDVQSAAILTAFRPEKWADYPAIVPEPGEQRPTTFGDIIIDPQGVEHRFEMVKVAGYEVPGFTEVTTIREQGYEEWLIEQQALNPPIEIDPETGRILSEIEEGWQKSPTGWESAEGGAYESWPQVTRELVEWELSKIHSRYYDDGAERPHDHWRDTPDAERLEAIYSGTSIKELDTDDAKQIIGRELGIDQVSDTEQRRILGDDRERLGSGKPKTAPGQVLEQSDYEIRMMENYRPRENNRERER